ncbi:hypothetical protein AAG906_027854 [Vitis piasezkii]
MMSESTYTVGPYSQLSFTEPPHTKIPSHQAPHAPDHAIAWINIKLASPLNLNICSRDLSVWRIAWISSRLRLSISNRRLSTLRVSRKVSTRR